VLSSILWNDFSITYRLEYTCSNCHFCHPDKEVRKARYRMLIESGVVIQEPDGTRRAVSREEAKSTQIHAPGKEKTVRVGPFGISVLKARRIICSKK
jgi:hypothetical protein